MKITWLGQSGYLLQSAGKRFVIDPYFSDALENREGLRRLVAPPCPLVSLSPDTLLVTHDHLDHFDPETLARIAHAFPDCLLIGPASVMDHAKRVGFREGRLQPIAAGETVRLGQAAITATPARHSDPTAVGFIFKSDAVSLWFSGDTLYYPELAHQVHQLAGCTLDIVFVCINGRLGNMNLREAASVVAALQPRLAVPTHYGMFAENTADPQEFIAACSFGGQPAIALECGHAVTSVSLLAQTSPL